MKLQPVGHTYSNGIFLLFFSKLAIIDNNVCAFCFFFFLN
jgi:hypothetical protein